MVKNGRSLLWIGLLLWGLVGSQLLHAGSLTGELDKTEGTLEDQFVYTLSIQGQASGEPQFPAIDGLEVQKAGTSQSVSIINGKFSRELQIRYILVPKRAGLFSIPSLKLEVDGKVLATLPLELQVQEPNLTQQADRSEQMVFLERFFSDQDVYVGQAIVARVKIYHRVKLYQATPEIRYPDGFQVRNLEEQKTYTQLIGGEEFNVTELTAVLTPTREGRFAIDPAVLQAKLPLGKRRSRSLLDEWMNSTEVITKRFRSEAATIEVLPLPIEGRRADFSGLVGTFQLETDLSPRNLRQGETVNLAIGVRGEGMTSGMADPPLDLPWSAKVYRDKPQSQDTVDGERGMLGQRQFKIAIVPLIGGTLSLGTLRIQYFDTNEGQYRDLTADLGSIRVEGEAPAPPAPATGGPALASPAPPEQQQVEILAEDLVEPRSLDQLRRSQRVGGWEWSVVALSLSSGLATVVIAAIRRRRRSLGDILERRRRSARALAVHRKELARVAALLENNEGKAALQGALRCLKAFLGDRLGVPSGSLTLREAEDQLRQRGVEASTLQDMRQIWQGIEQVLFAPATLPSPIERDVCKRLERLMQEVDRRC